MSSNLPARTLNPIQHNITMLLQCDLLKQYSNAEQLKTALISVMREQNRHMLYAAYCIGRVMNDEILSKRFGFTTEKLAADLGIGRATAFRYRAIARLLSPTDVQDLAHIPYTIILKLERIKNDFGTEKFDEIICRLKENDFKRPGDGATPLFEQLIAQIAHDALSYGNTLPDIGTTDESTGGTADEQVKALTASDAIVDAEVVESRAPSAVDLALKDHKKQQQQEANAYAENGDEMDSARRAGIALMMAKKAMSAQKSIVRKVAQDLGAVTDKIFQYEGDIIGDDDSDAEYRDLMEENDEAFAQAVEHVLRSFAEMRRHGWCLRKIQLPEGAEAGSFFDKAN